MASSSSSSAAVTSPFDSLPDKVVLKIVKMAACLEDDHDKQPGVEYDHDFLVEVLCKVSKRFKRLATDSSLWKGHVEINDSLPCLMTEFVARECLHAGITRKITVKNKKP